MNALARKHARLAIKGQMIALFIDRDCGQGRLCRNTAFDQMWLGGRLDNSALAISARIFWAARDDDAIAVSRNTETLQPP